MLHSKMSLGWVFRSKPTALERWVLCKPLCKAFLSVHEKSEVLLFFLSIHNFDANDRVNQNLASTNEIKSVCFSFVAT